MSRAGGILWLGILLAVLLAGGCQRRRQTPAVPAVPRSHLERGEQSLRAGDYLQAVAAYEAYLKEQPEGARRDQALYHLALAHAFAESPVRDLRKAAALLRELLETLPESSYRAEAVVLQSLLAETAELRAEAQQREQDIQTLSENSQQQEQQVQTLSEDVQQREQRIRALSEELQRLKEIDMRRRPARPPP